MSQVQLSDLTVGEVNGAGAFDQLMKASLAHIQKEYDAGRLKGAEYAQVYLGMLQAAMAQAVAFLQIQQQDELTEAQINKINAEIQLVNSERLKVIEEGVNLIHQRGLIDAQKDKSDAEEDLLRQRTKTEKAQIVDTVDGITVKGVLGKQKDLYTAQKDGFARDAEQKLAKIMTDVWATQRATDEGIQVPSLLNDNSINQVMIKAKVGIGAN